MFPVEKILVLILLVLILKTERIHIIVNVTIVLVYLNLAKIRRYYLSDPIEPYMSNNQQFDLLSWWRKNEHKYPKLAPMASLFLGTKCGIANNRIIVFIIISLSIFC